jgi:hypothetical protein
MIQIQLHLYLKENRKREVQLLLKFFQLHTWTLSQTVVFVVKQQVIQKITKSLSALHPVHHECDKLDKQKTEIRRVGQSGIYISLP